MAKAKKEIKSKDDDIASLKEKIKQLQESKEHLQAKHNADISSLRNGYQTEIDKAIKRAEAAESKNSEQAKVIDRQQKQIDELDRKANPQRYRLSSVAELIGHRFFGNNPYTVTLKIWTRVGEIEHTAVTYLSDSDKRLKAFGNGELT